MSYCDSSKDRPISVTVTIANSYNNCHSSSDNKRHTILNANVDSNCYLNYWSCCHCNSFSDNMGRSMSQASIDSNDFKPRYNLVDNHFDSYYSCL